MSRAYRDILTQLDLNGPYIRISSQPVSIEKQSTFGNSGVGRTDFRNANFTVVAEAYYLTGDSKEVGAGTSDATAPTVDNSGSLTYQWYEQVGDTQDLSTDIKLNSGNANRNGETSPVLNLNNLQSPSDHARRFYCAIDYIDSYQTEQTYETGNAVNGPFLSDTVSLTVFPHIIIETQPTNIIGTVNKVSAPTVVARLSDERFSESPTFTLLDGTVVSTTIFYNWIEEIGEIDNVLSDGTVTSNVINTFTTEETLNDNIRTEILYASAPVRRSGWWNSPYEPTLFVGIPSHTTAVEVEMNGGDGGDGAGDFSLEDGRFVSYEGGRRGYGAYGKFNFSPELISRINNTDGDTPMFLGGAFSGNGGHNGWWGGYRENNGGYTGNNGEGDGGFSPIALELDPGPIVDGIAAGPGKVITEGSGGDGGHAGPVGMSGGGGGGGGASVLFDPIGSKYLAICGGGGGGGGGSYEASGEPGENGGIWEEIVDTTQIFDAQQGTTINFNPLCGTRDGETINIDYGFYTKTLISDVAFTENVEPDSTIFTYERIVVIYDNVVVADLTKDTGNPPTVLSDSTGSYVQVGDTKYYASTHRATELGWCDDETSCGSCTRLASESIDLVNDPADISRKTGGYVNTFDVVKVTAGVGDFSTIEQVQVLSDTIFRFSTLVEDENTLGPNPKFGLNGGDKFVGDGGGGGGGGAGAISQAAGGTPGDDAQETEVSRVSVGSYSRPGTSDTRIIRVIDTETETTVGEFKAGQTNNIDALQLISGRAYDIVSDEEDFVSSALLRNDIQSQDFEYSGDPILDDRVKNRFIRGRTIGYDILNDGDGDYLDLVVTFGAGIFRVVPRSVIVDDELVGRRIIQYIAPLKVKNATVATGGKGGRSAYWGGTDGLDRVTNAEAGESDSIGRISLKMTVEKPFDTINEVIRDATILQQISYSRTAYPDLNIKSNYALTRKYFCRLTCDICRPISTVDSNTMTLSMRQLGDGAITIEEISDNAFANLRGANLQNNDLIINPSVSPNNGSVTRYYRFYSANDLDVDISLYGGKGQDSGEYTGGKGGFGYFRLRMQANTEYVIAGLETQEGGANTPFLYKKGRLIACVGAGGDAALGNGGDGGGVNLRGEQGNNFGGGGGYVTEPNQDGIFVLGRTNYSPRSGDFGNDTFGLEGEGGKAQRCTEGDYYAGWYGQSSFSPCEDVGEVRFRLADGKEIENTAILDSGFKSGYNSRTNGGFSVGGGGNGGSGLIGGSASRSAGGGGGGSGWSEDSEEFFVRRLPNERLESSPQGAITGFNDAPPYVKISRADVLTETLLEFVDYPDNTTIEREFGIDTNVDLFEPLPIIAPPDDSRIPDPQVTLTSHNLTPTTRISVNEGQSVTFTVTTTDIPAYTTFYYEILTHNSSVDDFVFPTDWPNVSSRPDGSGVFHNRMRFDTAPVGDQIQGSFTVTVKEDVSTEFPNEEGFGIAIYATNVRDTRVPVTITPSNKNFIIADTSRSFPSANILQLEDAGSVVGNGLTEGQLKTYNVTTQDVPIFPNVYPAGITTVGWHVVHGTTSSADFHNSVDNGQFAFSVANPDSSVDGTGSFTIQPKEDFATNTIEKQFSIDLFHHDGTVSRRIFDGSVQKNVIVISDTSQTPTLTLTPETETINEHGANFATGDSVTYTLDTTFVRDGTTFTFRVVPAVDASTPNTNITATIDPNTDFLTNTGTFTVNGTTESATGTFTVISNPDGGNAEGSEHFTVQVVRTGLDSDTSDSTARLVESSQLSVNDTANITYILDDTDGNTESEIEEGTAKTLRATCRFTSNPEVIYWKIFKIDGSTEADASDWAATSGNVSVSLTNNAGTSNIVITPTEDETTDTATPGGVTENFIVKIFTDSSFSTQVGGTYTAKVIDTSKTPVFSISPTAAATMIEGSSVVTTDGADFNNFTLNVENFSTTTTLYWRIVDEFGDLADGNTDFGSGNANGTFGNAASGNYASNIRTLSFTPRNDTNADGNKAYTLQASRESDFSSTIATKDFTVFDTSRPDPEWTLEYNGRVVGTDNRFRRADLFEGENSDDFEIRVENFVPSPPDATSISVVIDVVENGQTARATDRFDRGDCVYTDSNSQPDYRWVEEIMGAGIRPATRTITMNIDSDGIFRANEAIGSFNLFPNDNYITNDDNNVFDIRVYSDTSRATRYHTFEQAIELLDETKTQYVVYSDRSNRVQLEDGDLELSEQSGKAVALTIEHTGNANRTIYYKLEDAIGDFEVLTGRGQKKSGDDIVGSIQTKEAGLGFGHQHTSKTLTSSITEGWDADFGNPADFVHHDGSNSNNEFCSVQTRRSGSSNSDATLCFKPINDSSNSEEDDDGDETFILTFYEDSRYRNQISFEEKTSGSEDEIEIVVKNDTEFKILACTDNRAYNYQDPSGEGIVTDNTTCNFTPGAGYAMVPIFRHILKSEYVVGGATPRPDLPFHKYNHYSASSQIPGMADAWRAQQQWINQYIGNQPYWDYYGDDQGTEGGQNADGRSEFTKTVKFYAQEGYGAVFYVFPKNDFPRKLNGNGYGQYVRCISENSNVAIYSPGSAPAGGDGYARQYRVDPGQDRFAFKGPKYQSAQAEPSDLGVDFRSDLINGTQYTYSSEKYASGETGARQLFSDSANLIVPLYQTSSRRGHPDPNFLTTRIDEYNRVLSDTGLKARGRGHVFNVVLPSSGANSGQFGIQYFNLYNSESSAGRYGGGGELGMR